MKDLLCLIGYLMPPVVSMVMLGKKCKFKEFDWVWALTILVIVFSAGLITASAKLEQQSGEELVTEQQKVEEQQKMEREYLDERIEELSKKIETLEKKLPQ